jgi:hypothetical protein
MLYGSQARSTGAHCSYQRAPRENQDDSCPDSGLQPQSVRLFPYLSKMNIDALSLYPRFDIEDRKGLEIVILTALLTFQDVNETYHTPEAVPSPSPSGSSKKQSAPITLVATTPPQPPPKPAPKKGVERIAEMQAIRGEYNEIMVEDEGQVNDYANYCSRLLEVR